jgi:HK97 gp10 family phage protein
MSKSYVRVLGIKSVIEALDNIIPSNEMIKKARLAGAEIIREEAQRRAPGSIEIVIEDKDDITLIGPDKEHWYARFLEYGTTGHTVKSVEKKALEWDGIFAAISKPGGVSARPFLRPAFDENKQAVIEAIKKELYGN